MAFCYSESSHQKLHLMSCLIGNYLYIWPWFACFCIICLSCFFPLIRPKFYNSIWIWAFLLQICFKFSLTVSKYPFGICKSLRTLIIWLAIHFHFWPFITHSNINGFSHHIMNSAFQWCGILWNFVSPIRVWNYWHFTLFWLLLKFKKIGSYLSLTSFK